MELTRDQRAAAEACGCALVPATEEQVRRLTMQRRVFRLDGEPVLATRDGGFFETHATLAALIRRHAAVSGKRIAATDAPRTHDHAAAASTVDSAAATGHRPAQASPPGVEPPTPASDPSPPSEPISRRPAAEAAEPVPLPDAGASAADAGAEDAARAEETGVEGGAVPTRPRAPRQRRSGQPRPFRRVTPEASGAEG